MTVKEYLVTQTVDFSSRKIFWRSDAPMVLEHPKGWRMVQKGNHIKIWDSNQFGNSFFIRTPQDGVQCKVVLPPSKRKKQSKQIELTIVKLKTQNPAFVAEDTLPVPFPSKIPRQTYLFSGLRQTPLELRPVQDTDIIEFDKIQYFKIVKQLNQYQVTALSDDFKIKKATEQKYLLPKGKTVQISEDDLFRCIFFSGVHWYRFQNIPNPMFLAPLISAASDEHRTRLIRTAQYLLIFGFVSLSFSMMHKSKSPSQVASKTVVMQRSIASEK